jgi:hypothetical protein
MTALKKSVGRTPAAASKSPIWISTGRKKRA